MVRPTISLSILLSVFASAPVAAGAQDAFLVRQSHETPGPQISSYLRYQVSRAWQQDEERQATLRAIRTEAELQALRADLRRKLLSMIGGLPQDKTPLNTEVTGRIQLRGYHIENVIFESLPGFHVTANLYVPDGASKPLPAVLVPCGHSTNGKIHYQYICHRLAKLGYVVICWDPVGQGERSQFWDEKSGRSRYNLVCGEHAVLGNLAYLAGTNLARWEIWDGMRALDLLLSRKEVDGTRISIIGTSGGGFQAAHIAALDERITIAVPSCYITSLPMRMNNRIFADPDSDPEQDLSRMVADGVDHPGLLLLIYPRPLIVAAAVQDFFPIEGTRRTFREVSGIYCRFGHFDRVALTEGYHGHMFPPGNLEASFDFMNRFNGLPQLTALPSDEKLEDKDLLCTRSGQVLIDFKGGKSLQDIIREYYLDHKDAEKVDLRGLYRSGEYPGISGWPVRPYSGAPPCNEIAWDKAGSGEYEGRVIDRYLVHHSGQLSIPLVHIHGEGRSPAGALVWVSNSGKVDARNWPAVKVLAGPGRDVLSFDFRGLGENRMLYTPASVDQSIPPDFDQLYANPLMGVLADYVYNSLLIGRPYLLQMIEDAEIVSRFAREKLQLKELSIAAPEEDLPLAAAIAACIPGLKQLPGQPAGLPPWGEIVEQRRELWPIYYLLPGGAYVH
jgi:hypothetical protein